ncbi:MAG: DUF4231 domain-containing protein [Gemmatimonadota bacterium]
MPLDAPPLPRCTFQVAIVGHRWDRFPRSAVPRITDQLTHALRVIEREVLRAHHAAATSYSAAPPRLTLLSGLAAGADQLTAALAASRSDWSLHAVLPFPREQYARDFDTDAEAGRQYVELLEAAAVVTELDGPTVDGGTGERPHDAYDALAQVVVHQADLIVAVWDGQPSRGTGGTAAVIRAARAADVPLLILDPMTVREPVFEERPEAPPAEWETGMARQIAALLIPPGIEPSDPHHVADLRHAYFAEAAPTIRRASLFDLVSCVLFQGPDGLGRMGRVAKTLRRAVRGDRWPDPVSTTTASWRETWRGVPASLIEEVASRFAVSHGWADALASHYAARFRASYTRVFAFAWLAVVAAFVGTIAATVEATGGEQRGLSSVHVVALVVEALVLVVVFANVVIGQRRRYHERWMEYRALAERVRHLAILWPLGRTTPIVHLPPKRWAGDPRTSWLGWYLRCVAREAGLISGPFDGAAIAARRGLLRDGELERQRQFHSQARNRGFAIVHPLERCATAIFLLALLLALGNLVHAPDQLLQAWLPSATARVALLGGLGIALPALASGIHGFLATSDLESIASRSAGVAPRLEELIWRLDHLDRVDSIAIGEIALDAARVMEGELGTWRAVSAAHRLQPV